MNTRNESQLDKAILGLRSLIMSGDLGTGQRVSEVAMADRLGISRTPLRQAMDRLVAEGLLERIETGGCRVATFSKEDIADAIEVRGVIEGTAARLAAERGVSDALVAEARAALDLIDSGLDAEGGPDFDQYVKGNAAFHQVLARFPDSPVVAREIERMNLLPFASPSAFLSDHRLIPDFEDSMQFAQRQHRAILGAILNREGARAEALTREHARLALSNLNHLTDDRAAVGNAVPGVFLVASE